ncbi:MAG: hypothetical protein K1X26_07800 [Chitinophagales bacterium]|nr:hypothetical protein [Chitinophagales bacterium]
MASFKSDESFLEKIAIGAIGTQRVFENLKAQNQFPIELERGSMNYKIWKKIKIKRIRVPDILCVNSGIRIESRAKTNLEISMSHSLSDPDRGWDFGMKDNDLVALVVCEKFGEKPIDWIADELVQYISIKDLRQAEKNNQVVFVKPKGAEEGFEARINWPATISSSSGIIKKISENSIQFSREIDSRTISLRTTKKGLQINPLVSVGETIKRNQILASVVPVCDILNTNTVDYKFYLENLTSIALSERYAASKALAYFDNRQVGEELINKLKNVDEHIYIKLEAAASLAKQNIETGYEFILSCLGDSYLQNVLETVIILAEIKTETSCKILCDILLSNNFDPEIKAGAAWALGELKNKQSLNALIESFESISESIKIEASRSLAKLTTDYTGDIIEKFRQANSIQKSGIAWALTKSTTLKLDDLLNSLSDNDSRQWVSYIIGYQGEEYYINEIEKLKNTDSEVYFAVTVLWKILTSWINNLNEY